MTQNSSSVPATGESAAAPAPAKLRLANVTKTFENAGQNVEALKPINLEVNEGEYVVLFGPSGCGKSTLLNLIAGFDEPSSGEITLEDKPVIKPGSDRLMMFQEHTLFPWLNVLKNVLYGLRNERRFWFQP